MFKRNLIEKNMRSTFEKFGYREIQTPIFETLELFKAKSGDAIIDEIYSFTDKGGRELALRPELTAPVIRMYVDKLQMEPKPLKLFYFGNCYRYDRPQQGRYREFKQAGCEIIGTNTAEALSELIAMSYKILENTGLKNINLNIGNLKILKSIFKKINLTNDQQKYIIPLIDKSLYEDLFKALKDFKIDAKDADLFIKIIDTSDFEEIKRFVKDDKTLTEELKTFEMVISNLKEIYEIKNLKIKMGIVRGLDYYTDIVFEIEAPKLGAEKQICGGGAYELVSLFGGNKTLTLGFAIGFDRTILALESEDYIFPTPKLDMFVIPVNDDMIKKSLEITQKLRNQGASVDIDLLRRGLSKSLKYASSINAKKVIIVGPKELDKDSVTIRDMENGKQENVKIKNIYQSI